MQMNRRFYYSLGIRNFLRSFQFTFQLDNKQTNNMAAIPAVVAVAVLRNNRVVRRQNINKEGCVENDFCSLRLRTPQIHLLVTEYGVYGVWWRQNEMVDSSQLACEKRISALYSPRWLLPPNRTSWRNRERREVDGISVSARRGWILPVNRRWVWRLVWKTQNLTM